MTKTAAIAAGLAVVLVPAIIFIATATAPPVAGRVSAVPVMGTSFLSGLLIGSLIVNRRRAFLRADGRRPARSNTPAQQTTIGLAVAGLILIISAVLPDVLGWDTRLVMAMFGFGAGMPILLPGLRRAIGANRQ